MTVKRDFCYVNAVGFKLGFFLFCELPIDQGLEAYFQAWIRSRLCTVGKKEAGFAKFLLCVKQFVELLAGRFIPDDNCGVVGSRTLAVYIKPVTGLCVHHLFICWAEQGQNCGPAY